MKVKKLKPAVKIALLSIFFIVLVIGFMFSKKGIQTLTKDDNFVYVNDYIFDNYLPVIKKEEVFIRPYGEESVSVYKPFYDINKTSEEQQKALILYENIYMQNSGTDYSSDKEFNVLASVSGTITNVSDDKLLGKTVEIKNSNGIVTTYQCLSEVNIKKSDIISQGQIIGKSGTCDLYKDVKNGLHYELYINGSVVDPELYYDKSLLETQEKKNED